MSDKIDPQILVQSLETLKAYAKMNNVKTVSMLRETSELEDFQRRLCLLRNTTPNLYNERARCLCNDYQMRPRICTRR